MAVRFILNKLACYFGEGKNQYHLDLYVAFTSVIFSYFCLSLIEKKTEACRDLAFSQIPS